MPARIDNQKVGQATLTDFHNFKVIFVGKNADNTKFYEVSRWCHGCRYSFFKDMDDFRSIIITVYHSCKVHQGRPKSKDCGSSLTSAILPNKNVLGQVAGILEPENQNVCQSILAFLRRSGHI